MRKLAMLVAATAILSAGVLLPTKANAGCYRWGETGYHWYRYCAASAGMAVAGIARARKTSALMSAFARLCG